MNSHTFQYVVICYHTFLRDPIHSHSSPYIPICSHNAYTSPYIPIPSRTFLFILICSHTFQIVPLHSHMFPYILPLPLSFLSNIRSSDNVVWLSTMCLEVVPSFFGLWWQLCLGAVKSVRRQEIRTEYFCHFSPFACNCRLKTSYGRHLHKLTLKTKPAVSMVRNFV